jgi:hypothetical protein
MAILWLVGCQTFVYPAVETTVGEDDSGNDGGEESGDASIDDAGDEADSSVDDAADDAVSSDYSDGSECQQIADACQPGEATYQCRYPYNPGTTCYYNYNGGVWCCQ